MNPAWYQVDQSGCWIWQRAMSRGYGVVWNPTRRCVEKAHRWSYEQAKGPISDGLHIDHLCCNTACVNPEHLEAVTQTENNRRQGERLTHCKRGHEYTPQNTRVRGGGNGHRECRTCERERVRADRGTCPTCGGPTGIGSKQARHTECQACRLAQAEANRQKIADGYRSGFGPSVIAERSGIPYRTVVAEAARLRRAGVDLPDTRRKVAA